MRVRKMSLRRFLIAGAAWVRQCGPTMTDVELDRRLGDVRDAIDSLQGMLAIDSVDSDTRGQLINEARILTDTALDLLEEKQFRRGADRTSPD